MCISPKALKEWEYVSRSFEKNFCIYKGSRIALYSGECLDAVIRTFDHVFHFHCILEAESTEIPTDVDLVILTNFRGVNETDYNCIHGSCEEHGVPLLDLFGLDLIELHHELESQEYLTISKWKELLSAYDVISLSVSWGAADYNENQNKWVIRRRFLILYNWMISQNKTVFFFWEKEEQLQLLEAESIDVRDNHIKRNGKNRGYLQLIEQYTGKRILHIGTNTVIDGIVPREYGIDSRIIKYYSMPVKISDTKKGECTFINKKQLIEAIDKHEIISFDIFDTLLKRTVLLPEDVFAIVEERTGIRGFADARYEIQTSFPHYSLDEIYGRLKEQRVFDDRMIDTLRIAELQIESEVIQPRSSIIELFEYAKKQGKTVVLISDMYLYVPLIEKFLEKCGITGYKAIYLSYQFKTLKHEGLFEELLKHGTSPGSILHIGDNCFSDYVSAKEFGLDAFFVPSCLDLALKNGYDKAVGMCRTLADRKLLGLGIALGFDDPFEQVTDALISNMIVAPLAMAYLQWVCKKLSSNDYDYFLLSSRDGHILVDAYNIIKQKYPEKLPNSKYFYTSRHAAFLTVMDDYKLVKTFGNLSVYNGDIKKIFHQLFCLPKEELLPYTGESAEEYYRMHEDKICALAKKFRDNYRAYLAREDLTGKKSAVMDFVSEGSSQMMLENHIKDKMDGYYFGIPEYSSRYAGNISYYFDQDLMDYDTEMKLEVYFTSMEPSLMYIGEKGKPVFDKESRSSKTLGRIDNIHDQIQHYLKAYINLLFNSDDVFDKDLVFELCRTVNNYAVDNLYYDDMADRRIETKT